MFFAAIPVGECLWIYRSGNETVSRGRRINRTPDYGVFPTGRLKVGSYWVYFWANENEPLEPVHVHIAEGAPAANGTKVWITKAGKCLLCNNASQIPERVLRNVMRIIEARSVEVVEKWVDFFGEVEYYC